MDTTSASSGRNRQAPCCEPATSPFFNRRLIRLVRCEAVPSIAITDAAAHARDPQPSSRRLSIRLQRIAASENLNYRIAVLEDSPLLVGSLPANHSDAILRSAKGEINASEAELGAAVAGLAGLAGLAQGRIHSGQDAARRESIDLGCGLNM